MSQIKAVDRWEELGPQRGAGGDDCSPDGVPPSPEVRAVLRERAIPIRPVDLMRLLRTEPGLTHDDQNALDQLGQLLAAHLHFDFHHTLLELKELYDPLDPDIDVLDVEDPTHPRDLTATVAAFLRKFEDLLVRANYRPLSLEILREAVAAPNEMGLNYIPNFELFDHLQVWVRGETKVRRTVRRWKARFKKVSIVHDAYQRMVVVLKFKPSKYLDDHVRSDVLYLRMFKDVPHVDMEMHLPEQGTKVRMRVIDKAQIASPVAVSLPTLIYKLAKESLLWKLFNLGFLSLSMPTSLMTTLVVAPLSAGVNSFFGFQRAKQRHLHFMIRQLYYMTLANNASVLTRLVDTAEEEEFKEAILAYFLLWRRPGPFDQHRLDLAVEEFLDARAGLKVDFEIADALHKLRRYGLVEADGHGFLRTVSPPDALRRLDRRWDDAFRFQGRR